MHPAFTGSVLSPRKKKSLSKEIPGSLREADRLITHLVVFCKAIAPQGDAKFEFLAKGT